MKRYGLSGIKSSALRRYNEPQKPPAEANDTALAWPRSYQTCWAGIPVRPTVDC